MKNILTTILLLIATQTWAQYIVPIEEAYQNNSFQAPKKYYKDVNGVLNKFIGTWKWQDRDINPTKIFEITFYKNEKRDRGSISFTDELRSKFRYIEDNQIVYDTYQSNEYYHIWGSWIVPNSSFRMPNGLIINNNKMKLGYSEPTIPSRQYSTDPSGRLEIEYQRNGSQEIMEWTLTYHTIFETDLPFKIRASMTLVKQ